MISKVFKKNFNLSFLIRGCISVKEQQFSAKLAESDPHLFNLIVQQQNNISNSINLIASENYQSTAIKQALGSCLSAKYSEGYPGARYYGGNEVIDQVENLCINRALETYKLNPEEWGCNVQALSGSPANFYIYSALLNPHERLMGLDLPDGGHLSHGFQTESKKISGTSKYFESMAYKLNLKTGLIDYDDLEYRALAFRPKVIIAGASAYSRHIDYARMRQIADKCGAYLHSDMAHIGGLVAAGYGPNPFEFSDVVMTTTHKTLRGPRSALIFFRKGIKSVDKKGKNVYYDLEEKINFSVFPGFQGGPHNHTIAALATALKEAQSPMFKEYIGQVLKNSKVLANTLVKHKYDIVSGGTDNHLMLVDLRSQKLDGSRTSRILEFCNIYVNKNTVPGDTSAFNPKGMRLGSPAMTTRGLEEKDFEQIGEFLVRGYEITKNLQNKIQNKKISDFIEWVDQNGESCQELVQLKKEANQFVQQFEQLDLDI